MKKTGMKMAACLMALGLAGSGLAGCGGAKSAETTPTAAETTAAPETTDAAESTAAPETAGAAENTAAQEASEEEKKEEASAEEKTEEAAGEEDEEENYDTGDASLDNPRNGDEIGEQELLVVSFGTSFNDSRRLTIGAVEESLEKAFPEWGVRRGFTSQIIIDHVKKRDGVQIDNVQEALDRAVKNGVKTLVVQPTHLMNGLEYTDLSAELAASADAFEKIALGEPLLTSDEDFSRVADALAEATKEFDDGATAICFMGHGTEAESNAVYAKMQTVFEEKGMKNYFVGTVEAKPDLEDVLKAVQENKDYKRVVLRPMMIVAGDHANNDMAGDEPDSWKSVFEGAGYEVVCVVEGLGGIPAVQEIFAEHVQAAMDTLK